MAPWLAGVRSRSARREVVMGPHRADVVAADGSVVELQHSAISPEVVAEREAFYGPGMTWLFNATEAYAQGRIDVRSSTGGGVRFTWQHPRRSVGAASARVLLDLGAGSCSTCTTWPGADTRCAPMCSGRGCGTAPGCRTGPVCKRRKISAWRRSAPGRKRITRPCNGVYPRWQRQPGRGELRAAHAVTCRSVTGQCIRRVADEAGLP